MESNPLASYVYFCLKDLKVDLPYKGIVELYAKIFYTSSWINFLTTYSKFKVFRDVNISLTELTQPLWVVELPSKFPNRAGVKQF